jgi:hypothetical protein
VGQVGLVVDLDLGDGVDWCDVDPKSIVHQNLIPILIIQIQITFPNNTQHIDKIHNNNRLDQRDADVLTDRDGQIHQLGDPLNPNQLGPDHLHLLVRQVLLGVQREDDPAVVAPRVKQRALNQNQIHNVTVGEHHPIREQIAHTPQSN